MLTLNATIRTVLHKRNFVQHHAKVLFAIGIDGVIWNINPVAFNLVNSSDGNTVFRIYREPIFSNNTLSKTCGLIYQVHGTELSFVVDSTSHAVEVESGRWEYHLYLRTRTETSLSVPNM